MKNLQIPLRNVDVRTIYNDCAAAFRDKTALSYIDEAVAASAAYKKHVPKDIINFPQSKIKEGDEEKIIKIYTEKFAKKGSLGRKYYDAIMVNANGRCPICGSGKLKNLDHFMPKSLYPILCVTPANLIPVCRDCNLDKKDYFDTDYYSIPFNPYFDSMDDKWLECVIDYYNDNTYDISYKNGYDKSIDEQKWKKYEKHLTIFDLNSTFSARASEKMENCRYYFKNLLNSCGVDGVLESLIDHLQSIEKNDINSWDAALYRELIKEVNNYCRWLSN